MTAQIIPFPPRAPFAVRIEREGPAWLVVCRRHAWLYGNYRAVVVDADKIGHEALQQHDTKQKLREMWADSIFNPAGEVDRSLQIRIRSGFLRNGLQPAFRLRDTGR